MRNFIDQEITFQTPSGKEIIMTAASELVESYASGNVIDGENNHNLATIQDDKGNPLTFALKKSKSLSLIHKTTGNEQLSPYKEIHISETLGEVQAFGLGQNPDLKFNVCVASNDPDTKGKVNFYTASKVVPDIFRHKATTFNSLWKQQASLQLNADTDDRVNKIFLGNGNLQNGAVPGIIIATVENHQSAYYALWQGTDTTMGRLEKLDLGMTSMKIEEIAIGKILSGRNVLDGIYTLQSSRSEKVLRFSTFPKRGRQRHKSLASLPGGPAANSFNSLQVMPEDAEGRTGVYLGGKGLFHLPAREQDMRMKQHKFSTIVTKTDIKEVRQITTREDDGNITIWAHTVNDEMINVEGDKPETYIAETSAMVPSSWKKPITIARNIKEWAPIRNRVKKTNDLMVITQKNVFTHKIQDTETETWTDYHVTVENDQEMDTFESYATQLTFEDKDGLPATKTKLKFTSSEWCQALANSTAVELQPDEPIEIETDLQGTINFVFKPDTISAPIIRVLLGTEWQEVNPGTKIHDEIKGLDSLKKLKQARRHDNTALLPEGHNRSDKDLSEMVDGIKELNDLQKYLPKDGSSSSNYLQESDLETLGLPRIWGMEVGEQSVRFFREDAVYLNMGEGLLPDAEGYKSNWWESAFPRAAGHIFQWLKNTLERAFKLVARLIDGVYHIAVEIGKLAFRFVVKSLGQIYKAINWVLSKTIGITLEDIREWVGFLFSWEDIKVTHRVLNNVTRQIFPFGKSMIEEASKKIDPVFEDLKKLISQLGEFPEGTGEHSMQSQQAKVDEKTTEAGKEKIKAAQKSPVANFFKQQLNNSGVITPQSTLVLNEIPMSPALSGVMNEIKSLLNNSLKTFEEVGESLQEFFKGTLSLDKLAAILTKNTFNTLVDILHRLVKIIAKSIEEIIEWIEKLVTDEIPIPLFSALYKKLVGEGQLDVLTLLIFPFSVGITTLFKILTGKAPFHSGTGGLESIGYKELFDLFKNGTKGAVSSAQASAIVVLNKIGAFGNSVLTGISNFLSLLLSAAETKVPAILSGIFSVLGIICSTPLGNWNRLDVMMVWAGDWCKILSTIYDKTFPFDPGVGLGKVIDMLISAGQFIASCVGIIIDIVNNRVKPVQLAMSIWGGVNFFIGLAVNILLGACATAKAGTKIKEALLLMTGVGVAVESVSNLSHNVVSVLPGFLEPEFAAV